MKNFAFDALRIIAGAICIAVMIWVTVCAVSMGAGEKVQHRFSLVTTSES